MTTAIPVSLFYGAAANGVVYLADTGRGSSDDGIAFEAQIATDYIAPSGEPVGESILTALFVTLTWEAAMSVRVTPILDDNTYDATGPFDLRYVIALPTVTTRTTRTFLVPLYAVVFDPLSPSTPIARQALRGVWAGAMVETVGAFTGFFEFDEVQVEFEAVQEDNSVAPV